MNIKFFYPFCFFFCVFSTLAQELTWDDLPIKNDLEHNQKEKNVKSTTQSLSAINKSIYLLSQNSITYAQRRLTNDDYKKMGVLYLNKLDPYHLFFTKEDVNYLLNSYQIKRIIQNGDLSWVEQVYQIYIDNQKSYQNFFRKNKENVLILKNSNWIPKIQQEVSQKEIKKRWMDSLQDDFVTLSLQNPQFSSDEILIKMESNYENAIQFNTKTNLVDKNETFINVYLHYMDPHSQYFTPVSKSDFDMNISNTLEGIGLVWEVNDISIKVKDILKNSPASHSPIQSQDELIQFGFTPDMPYNVIPDKISNSLQKLRTNADIYYFKFKKFKTNEIYTVVLKKEHILLEKNIISEKIYTVNNQNILYIKIPSFYKDYDNPNRRGGSVSKDVRDLILKNQLKFNKILLDLRQNGGGIMEEATELSSLFLNKGISVHIKTTSGVDKEIDNYTNKKIWDGPVFILVDRDTASASEIFTASLQDYTRAMVIGENTFGKGTAQTVLDFDQIYNNIEKPLYGQLNLTTMMFFRPNGNPIQQKGVKPDILFSFNLTQKGYEKDEKNAIKPEQLLVPFVPLTMKWSNVAWSSQRKMLQDKTQKRLNDIYQTPSFIQLNQLQLSEDKSVSLNLTQQQNFQKNKEKWIKDFQQFEKSLPYVDDPMLSESLNVISDTDIIK